LALAQRVVEHALVFAHGLAAGRADFTRPRWQVLAEELAEIALADEADAGRVLLCRRRQPGCGSHRAHVALLQIAEWKHRGCELRLPELVQEIALVLAAVGGAQQAPVS